MKHVQGVWTLLTDFLLSPTNPSKWLLTIVVSATNLWCLWEVIHGEGENGVE